FLLSLVLLPYVFRAVIFLGTVPPTTYALSLHDALPIYGRWLRGHPVHGYPDLRPDRLRHFPPPGRTPTSAAAGHGGSWTCADAADRKSTRLNSSHVKISYAVFCWKKKKKNDTE